MSPRPSAAERLDHAVDGVLEGLSPVLPLPRPASTRPAGSWSRLPPTCERSWPRPRSPRASRRVSAPGWHPRTAA